MAKNTQANTTENNSSTFAKPEVKDNLYFLKATNENVFLTACNLFTVTSVQIIILYLLVCFQINAYYIYIFTTTDTLSLCFLLSSLKILESTALLDLFWFLDPGKMVKLKL